MSDTHMVRAFGPSILKTKLPDQVLSLLIKTSDEQLNNPELAKKYDWSMHLAGNVKKEVRFANDWLNTSEAEPFSSFITEQTYTYLTDSHVSHSFPDMDHPYSKINLSSAWIVSQWNGDFNPTHFHDGTLSGVCYLKMPDMDPKIEKEDHSPTCGKIAFLYGSPSSFNFHKFDLLPETGDFFLFPSWLMHTVYPFRTPNTERRSVSFNLYLT